MQRFLGVFWSTACVSWLITVPGAYRTTLFLPADCTLFLSFILCQLHNVSLFYLLPTEHCFSLLSSADCTLFLSFMLRRLNTVSFFYPKPTEHCLSLLSSADCQPFLSFILCRLNTVSLFYPLPRWSTMNAEIRVPTPPCWAPGVIHSSLL